MSEGSERSGDLDSLTLDGYEPATAPAEDPAASSPPDSPPADTKAVASDSEPSSASPASSPEDAPPATSDAQPTTSWTPEGEPFPFQVDGRDYPADGVLTKDGYVIWPKDAFEAFRGQVGLRETWGSKEAGYRRAIHERETRLREIEQQSSKALAEAQREGQVARKFLDDLVETAQRDPNAFVQNLDTIIAELPLKRVQAELELRKQQESQQVSQQSEEQYRQTVQQTVTSAQSHLSGVVEFAAKQAPWKGLLEGQEDQVQTLRELWAMHQDDIYDIADPGAVDLKLANGFQVLQKIPDGRLLMWNPGVVERLLNERVARRDAYRKKLEAALKAEKKNAAAVTQTAPAVPPAPPPQRARNENGQFVAKDQPKLTNDGLRVKRVRDPLDSIDIPS